MTCHFLFKTPYFRAAYKVTTMFYVLMHLLCSNFHSFIFFMYLFFRFQIGLHAGSVTNNYWILTQQTAQPALSVRKERKIDTQ